MTRTSWCATSIRKLINWNSCSTLHVFLCLCFALSCALLFVFLIVEFHVFYVLYRPTDCAVLFYAWHCIIHWLIVLYCFDLFKLYSCTSELTYLLSPCCRAGIFIALVHVYALLFLFNFEQTTDWLLIALIDLLMCWRRASVRIRWNREGDISAVSSSRIYSRLYRLWFGSAGYRLA